MTACAASPATHFYTLSVAGSGPGYAQAAYSVAVGPVTLPELVDRPRMVVRVAANQVKIVDQHRWAQRLGQ